MKKFTKRIIPMLVAMAMSYSSSAVAFAAETSNDVITSISSCDVTLCTDISETPRSGEETWHYTGYYYQYVGSFTMTGSNLTPVKTIPNDSTCKYLIILADFSCSYSSKVKVEIVDSATGAVLASNTSSAGTSGSVSVGGNVDVQGKKVQIRFILYDANGNYTPYRNCDVSYSYNLRGLPSD